jgi:hypothetical protein
VAAGIEKSFEARDRLLKTWYSTYLGRQAQGGEELGWVNQLRAGQTQEQVLSQFLSDPGGQEFYHRAQTLIASGTPDERYVQALYQVLLGRSATSAEISGWDAMLPSLGRQGAAQVFLHSPEFRSDLFEGYYNDLFHRQDDRAALNAWVNSNLDILSVRIGFESGPEFYSSP